MASAQSVLPERHFGFQCLNCKAVNFRGRRYSCGLCEYYQLCGECYDADLIPVARRHPYYHPLKVSYTRAEYQLYFDGEEEPYSDGNPMIQSYKCALCDVRGLTSGDLYKHLTDSHRSHPDYKDYVAVVFSYYQNELLESRAGPAAVAAAPAALSQGERQGRSLVGFLSSSDRAVRTTQPVPRRGYCEDGLSLAQLLVNLKTLNLTSPEFPIRCVEILHRADTLRARQTGQEVVRTAEKYTNLIEHEVATGLSERRLRLARTTHGPVRVGQRNGGLVALPVSNFGAGTRTAATATTTSVGSRLVTFPRRVGTTLRLWDPMVENEVSSLALPPASQAVSSGVAGPLRYRQALQALKLKIAQDTREAEVQPDDSIDDDKGRFLCSKFLTDNKPINRSRGTGNPLLRASFAESLFCSMLADEELSPVEVELFRPDAIKNIPKKKKTRVFTKPEAPAEISAIERERLDDMRRFYAGLDKFHAMMETLALEREAKIKAEEQLSIPKANSNSKGGTSALRPGIQQPRTQEPRVQEPRIHQLNLSDVDTLEAAMESIIQEIDALVDDSDL